MFGLEDKKRKKEEALFDLEVDLKNAKKRREVKEKVDGRINELKLLLRGGQDKEEFDDLGILLHGYTSLLKVIARFGGKA